MTLPIALRSATERDAYWDVLRGVAIIAVVWIHSLPGSAYVDWNFDYWITLRAFINFPVALFFFIAGYFVNASRVSPVGSWLRRRVVRLAVPFLIWSTIYFTIEAIMAGGVGSLLTIAPRIGLGLTAAHLYFVIVLIQLTLLTPLLVAAVRSAWWRSVAYAVTPAYLVVMYAIAFSGGSLPLHYNYAFPAWMVFYLVGIDARERAWRDLGRQLKGVAWIAVIVCVGLAIVESYWLLSAGMSVGFATSQLKASSVLCSLAVILLVLTHRREVPVSRLSQLGSRSSFGIYFVHLVWIMAVAEVYAQIPLLDEIPVLFLLQASQVALVSALSLGSIWLARRILGEDFAARCLGF